MKKRIRTSLLLLTLFLAFITVPVRAENNVYFNTDSKKVHQLTCHSGKSCTKNCIIIPREEAYKRGGVACKKCGG